MSIDTKIIDAKIICAGFGGQGVMSMGRLLAYTGMLQGREVSWLPSYGPEMRGGTANCHVIVSEHGIGSPIISRDATAAMVLNLPSLHKFEQDLLPGGLLLINSSLIEERGSRGDVQPVPVPVNEIATELGSAKVANMVMIGAYLELSGLFALTAVEEALQKVFGPAKASLLPLNSAALARGAESARAVLAK